MCCCCDACHVILIVALIAMAVPYVVTIERAPGTDSHWILRTNIMDTIKEIVIMTRSVVRLFSAK